MKTPYDELKKKLSKKKKQKDLSDLEEDHPVHEEYAKMGPVKE